MEENTNFRQGGIPIKIIWKIEDEDIDKVKTFYDKHKNNTFVQNRIKRNVLREIEPFTKDIFWNEMLITLMSTQQRSGPDSPTSRFSRSGIEDIGYSTCLACEDISSLVAERIRGAGLRRYNRIAEEAQVNLRWLENRGWEIINDMVNKLKTGSAAYERKAAEIIRKNLKGFGPKQSRNLLQSLGYTKFETPIDSRITKWLNKFGFPLSISATALSDINYYNFLSDGFQELCKASEIYPCVMDAAIFASYDGDWSIYFSSEEKN